MRTVVIGLVVDASHRTVLVQGADGYLNGVSGLVKEGEDAAATMVRAAEERTNLRSRPEDWTCLVEMEYPDTRIYYMRLVVTAAILNEVRGKPDHPLVTLPITSVGRYQAVSNIHWLLALAVYVDDRYETIMVQAEPGEGGS